jgi:carbonic anhydrase/acetyltransferase-like protein (isoleucine patch superfamily)
MALILDFEGELPILGRNVFLAPNSTVVGKIEIGDESNVWYGCVLRADVGRIKIGRRVNIQDLSSIHMTKYKSDAIIEDEASIGHGVIVHGAIVGAGALVGMGCVLMDNARIGEESIVGAGSLVTAQTIIPPRTLAFGRPARVIRELGPDEIEAGRKTATRYVKLAAVHQAAQPPPTK